MFRYLLPLVPALAAGCASISGTYGSGVPDRYLDHPPYRAGSSDLTANTRVVLLPLNYQRGGSQPAIFEPLGNTGTPLATLLGEMQLHVDSLARASGIRSVRGIPTGVAPLVYFGCELGADGDCVERGDSVLGRRGTTMQLALHRPSREWTAELAAILDSSAATHALLITMDIGQYWTRQRGLLGAKYVELGANYEVGVPWLTSLETPVSVIQLTSVLVGRDGRGVTVKAEGLMARRTHLLASAVGAQRLITDADVELLRTTFRTGQEGEPLVWQSALARMVLDDFSLPRPPRLNSTAFHLSPLLSQHYYTLAGARGPLW
jgi:hypothetical protein